MSGGMAKERAAYVKREDGFLALYWPQPRWRACKGCRSCLNPPTFHLRATDADIHTLFHDWETLSAWAKLRGMGPLSMVD